MEVMEELKVLEREILRLAQEIKMDDKYTQKFLDGTFTSISLTRHARGRRVMLITQVVDRATGKVNNPIVKSTNDDNYEVINKMEKLVRLIRAYRNFKKAEELEAKAREDLAVALVS